MDQERALHRHFTFTTIKPQADAVASSLSPTGQGGLNSNLLASPSNDDNGKERLKRHSSEVAGRVMVPDKWSQEEMLKDWLDFGSFDALLAPKGFDLARAVLVAERRQANKEAMESSSKAYTGMHYSIEQLDVVELELLASSSWS